VNFASITLCVTTQRAYISSSTQTVSLGVKRPGREPENSPPSNVEVKNASSYTSTPAIRLHGLVLS
jgi:hypothetical protein